MLRRYTPLAILLLSTLGACPARAEDQSDQPDLRAMGEKLHERLVALNEKPAQGWDGREFHAWKVYLKPRASRMCRRVRTLLKQKWILGEDGRAIAAASGQWTKIIRELSGLHPELAAADKGYRNVKVSETRAYRIWDRKHPYPKSIVDTPSYPALSRLRADIAAHRARDHRVPGDWLVRERELARAIEEELIAQQRAWKSDKETAYATIKSSADATRMALKAKQETFGVTAKLAYEWMAALQEVEEEILTKKIATLEGDARTKADDLLRGMAAARRAGKMRHLTSTAGYGQAMRQKWAGPRNKILALLAKSAAAEADKPQDQTADK